MIGFEENEISAKANGGTEITKRSIAKYVNPELANEFQIIASRVREINSEKIRVYWQHDLPEDPEISHLKDASSRDRFHKFVFVSNWQLNEYNLKLGMPLNENVQVIENPIDPIEEVVKDKSKVNLVYFSTPQRGLELLVPVFTELAKKYDNIHLDVFSSFNIYGWENADQMYEPLFNKIKEHPQMTYHGSVDQETLRNHLKRSHILAYPSVWKETSCRVLIESMSAGLMCVHPNLAALPETSGGLTTMYQFNENVNKHANVFYNYLEHAINNVNKDEAQNYLRFAKAYADAKFNISKISMQWKGMLNDLLERYPSVESRKIPEQMFTYNT
jgi:UDP-glucose:(glucosyl)LPS alpha-1,2-glucosyltransferase